MTQVSGAAAEGTNVRVQSPALEWAEQHWWMPMAAGVISLVFGVVVLFDIVAGAAALAVVTGFYLVYAGLTDLTTAYRHDHRVAAIVSGIILTAGGLVAIAWPGVTLLVLAWIFGATLFLAGFLRVAFGVATRGSGRAWLVVLGLVQAAVGVFAVAWPGVTVLALVFMLGIYAVCSGMVEIAAAFALRKLREGQAA